MSLPAERRVTEPGDRGIPGFEPFSREDPLQTSLSTPWGFRSPRAFAVPDGGMATVSNCQRMELVAAPAGGPWRATTPRWQTPVRTVLAPFAALISRATHVVPCRRVPSIPLPGILRAQPAQSPDPVPFPSRLPFNLEPLCRGSSVPPGPAGQPLPWSCCCSPRPNQSQDLNADPGGPVYSTQTTACS